MTSYLLQYYWPSLLSTGLLVGRRHHWSVTSPLCRMSWYSGSLDQNSVWTTELPCCSSSRLEHTSGMAAVWTIQRWAQNPPLTSLHMIALILRLYLLTYLLTYYLPWMQRVMCSSHLRMCMSVCLSCSCSNFWNPWSTNFIFVLLQNI